MLPCGWLKLNPRPNMPRGGPPPPGPKPPPPNPPPNPPRPPPDGRISLKRARISSLLIVEKGLELLPDTETDSVAPLADNPGIEIPDGTISLPPLAASSVEEALCNTDNVWNPRPIAAACFCCACVASCARDWSTGSRFAVACWFVALISTSCVEGAKAAICVRKTYRPLDGTCNE